jgi:hypothetical protein
MPPFVKGMYPQILHCTLTDRRSHCRGRCPPQQGPHHRVAYFISIYRGSRGVRERHLGVAAVSIRTRP